MQIRTMAIGACAAMAMLASDIRADDLAALAPADAYGFVGVGNARQLQEALESSSFGRLWNDPEVQAFTAPVRRNIEDSTTEILTKMETDRETVEAMFAGQIGLWVEPLEPYKPGEVGLVMVSERAMEPDLYRQWAEELWADEQNVELVKVNAGEVEIFGAKWMEGGVTDAEWQAQVQEHEQMLQNVPPEYHDQMLLERPEPTESSVFYAFPEGLFAMALDGDESIQRMLARQGSQGESLLALGGFQPLRSEFRPSQIRFFLNLGRILSDVSDSMAEEMGPMMTIDPAALGLGDLHDLSLIFDFEENRSTYWSQLSVSETPRGLAKALMSYVPADTSMLRAVPADPVSCSVTGFDFAGALTTVIETLRTHIPQAAGLLMMADGQVTAMTNMSLERELIPALGDQIVVATEGESSTPGVFISTYVLRLAQGQPIQSLLQTLATQQMIHSAGDPFLGAQIYNLIDPAMATPEMPTLGLAVGEDYLAFSTGGDALRKTIGRLSGNNAEHFMSEKGVGDPPRNVGGEMVGYGIQDVGQLLTMVLGVLEQVGAGDEDLGEIVDMSSLPDAATVRRYLGESMTHTYVEGGNLVVVGGMEYVE